MVFVSQILGRTVTDVEGESIGKLKDLIVIHQGGIHHPQLAAIEVRKGKETFLIPADELMILTAQAIPTRRRLSEITPFQPPEHALYLIRDVLDKQIIDVNGIRVVRVNDLELTKVNGNIYVSNVDVGPSGILRRLGLGQVVHLLESRHWITRRTGFISWEGIELIASDQPMRLKVPGEKLAELHPADLAEIISDLSRAESSKILETLDVKAVADTLEEVEPDFQVSLIEHMPDERIADVLEEMAPDEAADLLAELPDERGQELLNLMELEEAEDVRRLLAYPEESAGGIMTTEYATVRPDMTLAQVLDFLRATASKAETIYYVYVTDDLNHLEGVLSLRDIVLTPLTTPVSEVMETKVITVGLLDEQDSVAQLISKYNLLAVPVVDEEKCMHGIVTADDALDKIIPTAWKKRLPRLYH
jgi:magnesium transporter